MRLVKIGKIEELESYKKLLKLYEDEDFETKRSKEEARCEIEFMKDMMEKGGLEEELMNKEETYLSELRNMKDKDNRYHRFIKRMKSNISAYIKILEIDN